MSASATAGAHHRRRAASTDSRARSAAQTAGGVEVAAMADGAAPGDVDVEPSVGRTLASISQRAAWVTPEVGDTRAAILRLVEAADHELRVDDVAAALGLHANTVRGHLDSLLAAGLVARTADQRSTPGRPHWLYSATRSSPVRELARALAHELDVASAPAAARAAARIWADGGPEIGPAASIDEAVDVATQVLTDFGFDAVRNPVGDEITLRACPYAALVREHPVICRIHAELLGEVLRRTGQPVEVERLDVFPRPDLCVAHLHRPDVAPQLSIDVPADPDPRWSPPASRKK